MAYSIGRGDEASLADEAVAVARESADPAAIAGALLASLFGQTSLIGATPRRADWRSRAEEALDIATDLGDWGRLGRIQAELAGFEAPLDPVSAERWLEDARRWFRESQAPFHAIGDRRFELAAQSELAHVLRREGRIDDAAAEYRQTIRGWKRSGNRGAIANQLESFAFLALARGTSERAARLLGAAEALRGIAGSRMTAEEA